MPPSVLIIEKEPQTMRRLLHLFRAAGYAPLLAPSVQDALPLLSSERFDAVLTDDGDDSVNARALARYVRGLCPDGRTRSRLGAGSTPTAARDASDRPPSSAPPIICRTDESAVAPDPLFAAVVPRALDPLDLLGTVERAIVASRRRRPAAQARVRLMRS